MKHADLSALAVRWLYGAGGCKFVLKESTLGECEQPDAIGWRWPTDTILVECKATRSDFLADKRKPFRIDPLLGMGRKRYYLTPAKLVQPHELPDGWGLIYAYPSGGVRRIKEAVAYESADRNVFAEQFLLFATLRRFAQSGRWHQVEATWGADVPNEPLPLPAPLHEE